MIYIQQTAIVNHNEPEQVDVKALCREVAAKHVRRTDRFIQLGILGVEKIQRKQDVKENTALYITSGQGNIPLFKYLCDRQLVDKTPPKPVDFINSLSSSAGFYISQYLGLNSKNTNIFNHGFAVEMALTLADCELKLGKEEQILVGGIDQLFEPEDIARQYLGLKPDVNLGEGSNWMLLSNESKGSLASINVVIQAMTVSQLEGYIDNIGNDAQVAFSLRCPEAIIEKLLAGNTLVRFCYESQVNFYETVVLYALNHFVQTEKGKLIFIDYFEGTSRLIELDVY
ncbi:hypothetical protein [Granulosicoccus antarcticus]|uniref:Beta-ketoacyl synthase N-terminal domain-containing protein n=1 Tax=Granulosicoccus antarcticus IMCC3135 TaxID=1192854 RepID=A0A2Z2NVF2_9GAMM|nr:hypothetical protein [Granulosicoccus antarcticus]ASJ72770.1 hypothetical protein IMCC3135_13425 [Granulosicoccus antarcticus IMCC3135]